jgi:ATP-dependent DNA helicase RecQ
MDLPDPLLSALRTLTGRADAQFRDGQREAIEALVVDRARVLVVQRTGWGKSAVYFLTTYLLRREGLAPTLLISPLLSLMRNQISAAKQLGLRCATINSSDDTTIAGLASDLQNDSVDLVVISPERLSNPEFANEIMPLIGRRPGLLVIDEVHCISDWGHDFRPDYRRIGAIVDRLSGSGVPVLGCTATANDRVVADVAAQLGTDMVTFRGPLQRDSLALHALQLDRQAERLVWLGQAIPEMPGTGIIYCLTVRDTHIVSDWMRRQGVPIDPYHSDLSLDAKVEAEQRLLANEVKALAASVALGMGFDKPDLGFVVHFQSPGSPVAYYQQVGRAGRALDRSVAVLLRGVEDGDIQDYFIETAFADEDQLAAVVDVLDLANQPVSLPQLQARLNVRKNRLEGMAKQLEVDGILRRVKGQTYERTLKPWSYPGERIAEVTAARRREQQSMMEYLNTTDCRMQFLTSLLDDPFAAPCGLCDNCLGASGERELRVEDVAAAEEFLRKRPLVISQRKRCYAFTAGKQAAIPAVEQLEEGRALATWGDGGWGSLVRSGKQRDQRYDDRLVESLAEMLEEWQPTPPWQWLTAVPSLRHPELVSSLAARLAARLGIPYVAAVSKTSERPAQKTQQNSMHQERNVVGAFAVVAPVPDTPVLLLDDVVDSGWTMTEVGRLLRRAGSGSVYPVALASSAGRDS